MFITALISLIIYLGLFIFVIYMTKVFLCKDKNYNQKQYLFFYTFAYMNLVLRTVNLTIVNFNYFDPGNSKLSAWINITEVFCITSQLFIGFLQFDVFACEAIAL